MIVFKSWRGKSSRFYATMSAGHSLKCLFSELLDDDRGDSGRNRPLRSPVRGANFCATICEGDRPPLIPAAAHDRFAVEAFANQAFDFALKPFDRERFKLALIGPPFIGHPNKQDTSKPRRIIPK